MLPRRILTCSRGKISLSATATSSKSFKTLVSSSSSSSSVNKLSIRNYVTAPSAPLAPVFGSSKVSSSLFAPLDKFEPRHLGPRESDVQSMLETLGYSNMDQFLEEAVPSSIRLSDTKESKDRYSQTILPLSESELLRRGNEIANMNSKVKSLIGMGYHNTLVPNVILRNVSQEGRGENLEERERGR